MRPPETRGAAIGGGLLLLAAALGFIGAHYQLVFALVAALVVALGVGRVAYVWPGRALQASYFIVLVAGTRFRVRDPTASLSGQVDAHVVLELGLYAVLAFVIGVVVLSGAFRWSRWSPMESLLLAYVSLAVCSVLWSVAPTLTAVRSAQLGILYLLTVASLRVLGPGGTLRGIAASLTLYVLGFSLLAVMFPWASKGQSMWQQFGFERFQWFWTHPIACGTFAAVAAMFVVCDALSATGPRGRGRALARLAIYGIPLLLVLGLTRARGPGLAFFAALGVLPLRKYARWWVAPSVVAGVLTFAVVYLNSGVAARDVLERATASDNPMIVFALRGQSAEQLAGLSGRIDLWQDLKPVFMEQPVLGYGYQASRAHVLALRPWAGYAHNALAQTLLDLGLLGTLPLWFAAFTCVATGPLRAARRGEAATWERMSVLAVGVFLLVNSVSAESFAAAPGFDMMMLFVCILAAERLRAPAPARSERDARRAAGLRASPVRPASMRLSG